MLKNRSLPPRFSALAALAAVAMLALPASAQQPSAPIERTVRAFLEQHTAGLPGKAEVSVGAFDSRNNLPACAALEAFLPSGTRPWGQINVGVRCDSPAPWTAYVPARIAVMTEYLVTVRPLRAGQIVGPADIERRHGDLAAEPPGTLTDPAQAVGHPARYAVAVASTLRAAMLRLPAAVRQGQAVKVVGSGNGFSVSNEGRALNAAAEGEPVRVRLKNDQVVSGLARQGGIVELQF